MDRRHCIINVKRNRQRELVYTLRDAPSLTGTFLMNEILGDKDRIRIDDGAIITIGATTLILRAAKKKKFDLLLEGISSSMRCTPNIWDIRILRS